MSDSNSPPEWADNRHISNGTSNYCFYCLRDDNKEVKLEVEKTARLATWMGVNWEDGFEERVRCPECERMGQITTKLMNERTEKTRFSTGGAAAKN